MTTYTVSVYASVIIEAETEEQAKDIAQDMVIGCSIKTADFEFDANELS